MSQIDLTDIEYENLRRALRELIPTKTPQWKDWVETDPGIVILDLVAAVADMGAFYLDKRTNEMILTRARTRQAVIDHGKLFDYSLRRRQASTSQVTLRTKPGFDLPDGGIIIPAGVRFSTEAGIVYTTKTDKRMTGLSVILTAYEGTRYEEEYPNTPVQPNPLSFELGQPFVASNYLKVKVDGEDWEEDTFLPSIEKTKKRYVAESDETGYTTLKFNSFRYQLPEVNHPIDIAYLTTSGSKVGVKADSLTKLSSDPDLYDWPVYSEILEIASNTESVGGLDEEDFTQIKHKVPAMLGTLWRAVALHDYKELAKLYPGVLDAEAVKDDSDRHHLNIYVMTENDLPNDFLTKLRNYLLSVSVIGVTLSCTHSEPFFVDFTVVATLHSRTIRAQAAADLEVAVRSLVGIHDTLIGQRITVDDVYKAVSNVKGVESFRLTRMAPQFETGIMHIDPGPTRFARGAAVEIVLNGGV